MKPSKSGLSLEQRTGRLILHNKHNGHFIKDKQYYKNDQNTWNNPQRSCQKVFDYYHRNNIINNQKVDIYAQQAKEYDKLIAHEIKKDFVLNKRREAQKLFQKRKMERIIIQRESNQILEPHVDETICESIANLDEPTVNRFKLNKSGFRSFFRNQKDNKWNDLTFSSNKTAKLYIPDLIIRRDEEATKSIMKKIQEERSHHQEYKLQKLDRKTEIYEYAKSLKSKNEQNLSAGLPSEIGTLTKGFPRTISREESSLAPLDRSRNKKSETNLLELSKNSRPRSYADRSITALSRPKLDPIQQVNF